MYGDNHNHHEDVCRQMASTLVDTLMAKAIVKASQKLAFITQTNHNNDNQILKSSNHHHHHHYNRNDENSCDDQMMTNFNDNKHPSTTTTTTTTATPRPLPLQIMNKKPPDNTITTKNQTNNQSGQNRSDFWTETTITTTTGKKNIDFNEVRCFVCLILFDFFYFISLMIFFTKKLFLFSPFLLWMMMMIKLQLSNSNSNTHNTHTHTHIIFDCIFNDLNKKNSFIFSQKIFLSHSLSL